MINRALFAALVCVLALGSFGASYAQGGQGLPQSGGWIGQEGGGGLLRSGRFPDKCAALTWRVAKGIPLTLVEGLPDPIYLELCNCRVDAANNSAVLVSYASKAGAKARSRQLGIGQCLYVAAVDLTITAKDLEAFGIHEVVANPRQTITIIDGDDDDDAGAAAQE